jgi:hypothetical protein
METQDRRQTALNTAVIGDDLIRYASVSAEAPWRLLDCQRGAWGTHATAHAGGDAAAKLMDHDYKIFLTDAELSQEVARNIARVCNHAGALQISLDGLEGNWSTGMGRRWRHPGLRSLCCPACLPHSPGRQHPCTAQTSGLCCAHNPPGLSCLKETCQDRRQAGGLHHVASSSSQHQLR